MTENILSLGLATSNLLNPFAGERLFSGMFCFPREALHSSKGDATLLRIQDDVLLLEITCVVLPTGTAMGFVLWRQMELTLIRCLKKDRSMPSLLDYTHRFADPLVWLPLVSHNRRSMPWLPLTKCSAHS